MQITEFHFAQIKRSLFERQSLLLAYNKPVQEIKLDGHYGTKKGIMQIFPSLPVSCLPFEVPISQFVSGYLLHPSALLFADLLFLLTHGFSGSPHMLV